MPSMSADELRAFLTGPSRTAKLACVRADGRPHVTPVWFLLDGDDIVFTTYSTSIKGTAILRDPRVCVCVDDDRPPFSYAVIHGVAHVSTNLDELRDWAGRLGARYLGEEARDAIAARNGVPGELLVRVTPTSSVGEHGVAS